MESTLYKNTKLKKSGVLNGPVTLVYGVGGIALILINKYTIKNKKTGIIYKNKVYYMVVSIIYAHENTDFKAIK